MILHSHFDMDFMFDWETEGDRFSFDDSDRFEEDSLCSWISEPESLCNNWRGWRRNPNGGAAPQSFPFKDGEEDLYSLKPPFLKINSFQIIWL